MSAIKTIIGALSAMGFLCGVAVAMPNGPGYAQNPYYETEAVPVGSGARQVNHPAWSFACSEPDVAERIVPCDEPIWVYGEPCEVATGLQGLTRPCRH